MSLRASESCLPKGGAAQLSFVPSPDGASSDRHSGQSHEFPPMPMGASTSETPTCLGLTQSLGSEGISGLYDFWWHGELQT